MNPDQRAVSQIGGKAHRIDRHHDGIGAQDCIEANDELWTVLHVQDDALTWRDATLIREESSERVDFTSQLRVARFRSVVIQRGLARIAGRGDFKVVVKRGLRRGQMMRKTGWPMCRMFHVYLLEVPRRLQQQAHRPVTVRQGRPVTTQDRSSN